MIASMRADPSAGAQHAVRDLAAHLVEAREAAQVHLPGLHPDLEGLVRHALSEGGEERGGHREELAGQLEPAAHLGQRVLEPIGGVAVGVEPAAQLQHEVA